MLVLRNKIFTGIKIHTYIHKHIYILIYIRTYIEILKGNIQLFIRIDIYTMYKHIHIHTFCLHLHLCIYLYLLFTYRHTPIHTYACVYVPTYSLSNFQTHICWQIFWLRFDSIISLFCIRFDVDIQEKLFMHYIWYIDRIWFDFWVYIETFQIKV